MKTLHLKMPGSAFGHHNNCRWHRKKVARILQGSRCHLFDSPWFRRSNTRCLESALPPFSGFRCQRQPWSRPWMLKHVFWLPKETEATVTPLRDSFLLFFCFLLQCLLVEKTPSYPHPCPHLRGKKTWSPEKHNMPSGISSWKANLFVGHAEVQQPVVQTCSV